MKLVVIESPYRGSTPAETTDNVIYARRCMADSLARGEAPFASHLLYAQPGILDDAVPVQRALGIGAGLAWATRADLAVFYTDRGWSAGMRQALSLYQMATYGAPFEFRALDGPVQQP